MEKFNIDPDLLKKIQKLINLEEGARAVDSKFEAENAAAKLQILLMKHNLDISMVQAATIQKKIEINDNFYNLSDKFDKREAAWVPKLFEVIADNNLCRSWSNKYGVRIIGHTDTVQLVMYIAEQMIAKVRIAEKEAWKKYEAGPEPDWGEKEKRGTFRRGFYDGCVQGIGIRLRKEKDNMQATDNPYAVMIVSREKEIDEFMYGTQEERDRKAAERAQKMNEQKEFMASPEFKALLEDLRDSHKQYVMGLTLDSQKMFTNMGRATAKERIREWYNDSKRYERRSNNARGPRGLSSNDGYVSGVKAGENLSINKGVDNSNSKGNIK